jgi:hypothetical protein
MTSYNAINGTPSVADTCTTNQIAQRTYGFGGYITSGCGAVGTTYTAFPSGHNWAPPGWTTNGQDSGSTWTSTATGQTVSGAAGGQAWALRAGTNVNCTGTEATPKNLEEAIGDGVLSEGAIDNALAHLFTIRMETGEFDPASAVPYTKITKDVLQSKAHQDLATKVADNALVLLRIKKLAATSAPLLPADPVKLNKVVILGDQAGKVTLGGCSGSPTLQANAVQGITLRVEMVGLAFHDSKAGKQVVHDGPYRFQVGPDSATVVGWATVQVHGAITPAVQYVTVQPEAVAYPAGDTIDVTVGGVTGSTVIKVGHPLIAEVAGAVEPGQTATVTTSYTNSGAGVLSGALLALRRQLVRQQPGRRDRHPRLRLLHQRRHDEGDPESQCLRRDRPTPGGQDGLLREPARRQRRRDQEPGLHAHLLRRDRLIPIPRRTATLTTGRLSRRGERPEAPALFVAKSSPPHPGTARATLDPAPPTWWGSRCLGVWSCRPPSFLEVCSVPAAARSRVRAGRSSRGKGSAGPPRGGRGGPAEPGGKPDQPGSSGGRSGVPGVTASAASQEGAHQAEDDQCAAEARDQAGVTAASSAGQVGRSRRTGRGGGLRRHPVAGGVGGGGADGGGLRGRSPTRRGGVRRRVVVSVDRKPPSEAI